MTQQGLGGALARRYLHRIPAVRQQLQASLRAVELHNALTF